MVEPDRNLMALCEKDDVSRSIWTRPSHLTPHPTPGQFPHAFSVKMAIPVFDRRRKIISPLSGLILKASPSH